MLPCFQAELTAVSPQEEFNCSLGVDPAVKVTYKPLAKFREQSGLISKTVSTMYKQVTEIKNSRQDSIKVIMKDQLPLSTEEKIKVGDSGILCDGGAGMVARSGC